MIVLSDMNEQLTIFDDNEDDKSLLDDLDAYYSKAVYDNFEEINFKLLYHRDKLLSVYHRINRIIPAEKVVFSEFPLCIALTCELICVSICNNINWDFLRKTLLETIKKDISWISISHLKLIKANEIEELFKEYNHYEKINSKERSMLLRELATTYEKDGFESIFFDANSIPNNYDRIRNALLKCKVFNCDSIEKKIQLLIMKLSKYDGFQYLANECKPTIDYHIIRTFTRRGYLLLKNNSSIEFINSKSIHNEKTIAAVRRHCANIISSISNNTSMSLLDINIIEWWIGRSICIENEPDCNLSKESSVWLRSKYDKCPFYNFCLANNKEKQLNLFGQEEIGINLKRIESPNYKGNSF